MNEPKDNTMTDTRIPAEETAAKSPAAESETRSTLTHNLKNAIYAIMLQAECAEASAAAGETDAALEGIAKVKSAARDTAELLDDLLEDVREE